MATKKSPAAKTSLFDNEIAASVRDSAQQIWLAGMGAFAKAQAEGGKVFEALVKEGQAFQQRAREQAEERFGLVTDKVGPLSQFGQLGNLGHLAEDLSSKWGAKASEGWDKLETLFEQRTAKALARLGVPMADEVAALQERVAALEADLARLTKKTPVRKSAKTAIRRPARKNA